MEEEEEEEEEEEKTATYLLTNVLETTQHHWHLAVCNTVSLRRANEEI